MKRSSSPLTIQRLMLIVAGSAGLMWFSRLIQEYPTLAEVVWIAASFVLAVSSYLLVLIGWIFLSDAVQTSIDLGPARTLWSRLTGKPQPPRFWKPTRRDGPR